MVELPKKHRTNKIIFLKINTKNLILETRFEKKKSIIKIYKKKRKIGYY